MNVSKISNEEMLQRIARFEDVQKRGIPLMFIDSVLPKHQRMNYSVVGDTASENPEFDPILTQPHQFQIGMVKAPPGCGPAFHTHDYIEAFMPLTGQWRYYWGNSPDDIEGETTIGPWDFMSLPPGLWRGFENISDEDSWLFAVLEPHSHYTFKDPYWAQSVIDEARGYGFEADESGKMIKPHDYTELRAKMMAKLNHED